jgi:hypothetical protein
MASSTAAFVFTTDERFDARSVSPPRTSTS